MDQQGSGSGSGLNEFGEIDTKILSLGPRLEKEKKAKKEKLRAESDNLTTFDKQLMMSHFINDTANNPAEFSPPSRFVLLCPDGSQKLVYEITEDGELIWRSEAAVASMLGWCSANKFAGNPVLEMCATRIDQAVKFWFKSTAPIEEPKMIAWKGEDCIAYRKLPFELKLGDTPLFDELMSRITNSTALMSFIGSLMFENSNMQQYVWLHGQGGDGKGALCRFLQKAFGNVYSGQQVPQAGDRFWTEGIRGKRLVVFPDCNNTTWVTSGMFKALSGGDMVRVEKKNAGVWSEIFKAKFIFVSNEKPDISSERADMRRIIYCESKSFEGKASSSYEHRLWQEGGYFLSKCASIYLAMCPEHDEIPRDEADIKEIVGTNEEHFAEFLDRHFTLGKEETCSPKDFQDRIRYEFKNKKDQAAFRMWLERSHYVVRKSVRNGNVVRYLYVGIKPKYCTVLSF